MWFIIGLVVGIALLGIVFWLRNRNVSLTWYEWLLGIVGFLLLLLTLQNALGSIAEMETTATWMFLVIPGIPALILIAIAGSLVWRRQRAAV